ncbi:hypothetical protein [Herbaspirillum robiniae]|uniref:hypothetical protein n=1 Tax=Herbaspirillum robiniae TaxID=2014887 RepID=UPI00101AEC52|nr:hypothetical protein [Herbaspirillum robiniae]
MLREDIADGICTSPTEAEKQMMEEPMLQEDIAGVVCTSPNRSRRQAASTAKPKASKTQREAEGEPDTLSPCGPAAGAR